MTTRRTRPPNSKSKAVPADAVDAQLARYRSMRDFGLTAEPGGGGRADGKPQTALPFVIQKHAASHLHYDFRLGWNGVLKSWAVAKGPSYRTADKRLAVQVEDHPIEYGGFEGIIPKGQYGGGTVMVWDQGTWEPQAGHTDVDAGLRDGSLKITLHGTKLEGNWALVRMGGKAASERKPNWLLIKEHDAFERTADSATITDEMPNSVVTGRTLDEIAAGEDHVWNSNQTARGNAWFRQQPPKRGAVAAAAPPAATGSGRAPAKLAPKQLQRLPQETLPGFLAPQLAAHAARVPEGDAWLHELKLDGYRMQALKRGSEVKLLTRNGLDWTPRMKTIAQAVAALPVEDAIFDGEVVVLADDGTTSFAELQAAFEPDGPRRRTPKPLTYFVFDLLHLNGRSTRALPLVERKALLAKLLGGAEETVRLSEHLERDGEAMFHAACKMGAEGIVSKRAAGVYRPGRGSDWIKSKCIHEQEFVVGGFTLPSNAAEKAKGIGALLLGYYRDERLGVKRTSDLIYAGRTGTGFTQATHRMLRQRLDALRQDQPAFETVPASARRGVVWVKPQLVAQVHFATWTAENLLRQAAFLGLREDKSAAEVTREDAATPPRPRRQKAARTSLDADAGDTTIENAAAVSKPAPAPAPAPVRGAVPVRLTHPDKLLDESTHLTKQRLAEYYWTVAARMLPHIAGRPLSLVRCPEGSAGPCFFQKHRNNTLPPGIESIDVRDRNTGKLEPYITLSTPEALAGLAQMGVLEVHPWGSQNDNLERPDRIIIDLDPDAAISWPTLAATAAETRKAFQALGLVSFLKLTGGKGLHVVVPIAPEHDWAVIKQFAHAFVVAMERARPTLYLTKMSKAARKDRIYLDYLRNERGATAVAAFSPRARVGAAVSLPLGWSELKSAELPVFHAAEFAAWHGRLAKDPWKTMARTEQGITAEMLRAFKIPP